LEDSLLRSEARVRGVLAALPDLVFEVNSDGVLLNYYAATPSDLGYPPEAFLGKSVREVLPSQLADSIEAAMTAARKTGTVQLVEYQLPTLNGRLAWWEARIAPTSTGFVDVVRNITERKRAEEKLSQSEKRYRSLFDQTLDGVYRSTHEGRFADVNPAFVKMFGYSSKQDMLDIQDIKKELYFSPEDRASHFLDTGQEKVEVFRMRRKGGSEIWVEDHGRYVHDERGNVMFHEGILRDVTERVRAELNLRLQAEITENMFEGLVLVRQADGVIVQTNPRFEAMFGYSPSELAGKNMATVIAPMDGKSSEDVAEEIISAVRETGSWTGEVRSVSKEGAPFWCQANVSALESSEYGAIWVATHQDITERKRLQEALRRRVQELDSLQETLLEITGQHDLSQLLNRIVERAAALLDAPGGGLYLCDHEKQEARCVVSYNTKVSAVGLVLKYGEGAAGVVAQTGNPLIIDDYRTWPGRAAAYEEDRPFGAVLSAPMIWQGQVIGVIHILRYDTRRFTEENLALLRLFANHAAVAVENARLYGRVEQHAAQLENKVEERTRKLAESEKRFRELADLLPQVVYEIDERGYFTFVNRSALTITGYTHDDIAKGLDALQLFAESDRDRVKKNIGRVLAGETLGSTEYVARRKDGSTFPVLITSTRIIRGGRAAGLRGIVMDITERKQMEDRLLKAERLAAVGETAAMVGHDLRNPLQAISAATYVLKKNLTPPANERTREMLEAIENGVRYADRIVSDLTEYSQDLRLELSETTPKSLIREAIQQVKIPKNIIVSDSTSDDPKVRVDRAKIKRIFINLIENAIDAMATGGKLEISSIRSNSHLEVKFTDTGQGIPENVLRELWKPLITTKPKGMGLGLAICKRIAEAHSGSISVESRIGEGTTFTLELPINPPEGAKKA
jgi:PAS domain S-box-containing protein